MEIKEVQELVSKFIADGNVVSVVPFGNGHINDTFKVVLDTDEPFLLQRVNHNVFKDVKGMMRNIQLRKKANRLCIFSPQKRGKISLKLRREIIGE